MTIESWMHIFVAWLVMLSAKFLWLHSVNRKKMAEEKKEEKAKRRHLQVILALNTKPFISVKLCGYLQSPWQDEESPMVFFHS